MIFKRLWWTIRLCMIGDSMKRAVQITLAHQAFMVLLVNKYL